ncbi:MAG: hypothetical protein QXJ25_03080 [Candidatus Aenigmatarchaeota archaeon]
MVERFLYTYKGKKEKEDLKKKEKIFIVDITEEIESVVHQLAEELTSNYIKSLRENQGKGFVSKLIGGIKVGLVELSRNYIYHQFREKIEKEVRENYNIFQRIALEGKDIKVSVSDKERMSEFLKLVINRFESGIAERFSRDIEIGKRIEGKERDIFKNLIAEVIRDFISDGEIETPEGRIRFNKELSKRLKDLIDKGDISPELFYGEKDQRIFNSPEAFSSNIYDYLLICRRELGIISQKEGLTAEQREKLNEYITRILNIDIELGRLTSSVRTKLPDAGKKGTSDYTLSYIEKLCINLENKPILGKLINPITVGLLAGIASKEALIRIGGRGLATLAGATLLGSLGYLSAPILVGAGLAGVFSYYRTKARFKQDVGKILREQAAGLNIEDPRAKKLLERIALPGGEEFRKNIKELIDKINSGDKESYIEALARLELEYETRTEASLLPQLDLLIGEGSFRSTWIERSYLENVIFRFEENLSDEEKRKLRDLIEEKKKSLRDAILGQDKIIKKEAFKEGLRRGVLTGLFAAGLGTAVQYLRDAFGETLIGEKLSEHPLGQILATRKAKEKINLLEYILGERPNRGREGFTSFKFNDQEFVIFDSEITPETKKIINLPGGEYAILRFDPDKNDWVLDLTEEAKKLGWKVEGKTLILEKTGIEGNVIENWDIFKNHLEGKGYGIEKVTWTDFAYENKPPKVISWQVPPDHPGFLAEGLELKMSWKLNPDGSVNVKVPVEGIAFRTGKEWNIIDYVKSGKAGIFLSPRRQDLQFEGLWYQINPEDINGSFAEIKIPKEIADIFFIMENGKLKLNGAQLTYNLVIEEKDGIKSLVSVSADYNPKVKNIAFPSTVERYTLNSIYTPPTPPVELDPGIPIPFPFGWRTIPSGEYKEASKLPLAEPYPEHYYGYSGFPYKESLDWVERFGIDFPEEMKRKMDLRDKLIRYWRLERINRGLPRMKKEYEDKRSEAEKKLLEGLVDVLGQGILLLPEGREERRKYLEKLKTDFQGELEKLPPDNVEKRKYFEEKINQIDYLLDIEKRIKTIEEMIEKRTPELKNEIEELSKEIIDLGIESEILKEESNIREKIRGLDLEIEKYLINQYLERLNNKMEACFEESQLQRLFSLNKDIIDGEVNNYRDFIEKLAASLPPMSPECRVSIFIPSYREEKYIRECLEKYVQQIDDKGNPIDPKYYEIVILENVREGEDWDATEKEIEKVRLRYPEIKIHLIRCKFPKEIASVGLARAVLSDVIAFRAHKRENPIGTLHVISEDADLIEIDSKIVYRTIERFDRFPEIDYMRGVQVRDPEVLSQNMLAWLERSGWQVVENLFRTRKGFSEDWYLQLLDQFPDPFSWGYAPVGAGWNAAYRLAIGLMAGCYNPLHRVGEDLHKRNVIMLARSKEKDKNGNPIPNAEVIKTMPTTHISSMRRFLIGLLERPDIYSSFGEQELEKKIRESDEKALLSMLKEYETINENNLKVFEGILNSQIGLLFNILANNPEEAKRRAKIYLTIFHLREERDYYFDELGKGIKLTDSGTKRLKFLFELFRVFLTRYDRRYLAKMKLGIWPVWSGFELPPENGRGDFGLINVIGEQLGIRKEEGEDFDKQIQREERVIDEFLNLSDNEKKLQIIESLISLKKRK